MKWMNNLTLITSEKKRFERTVIKNMKGADIKKLPPTNSAAKYHSFRVYYQVQVWLGNENIHATDWGWILREDRLLPKIMDYEPALKSLSKIIKFGCSMYCDNNQCTCKRNGLFCSEFCVSCTSGFCKNIDSSNLVD